MKVRLVLTYQTHEFNVESTEGIAEYMDRHFNLRQTGIVTSPHVRFELRAMPRFEGLVGPMWDGNALRYETQDVYDQLSV